jgi:hypothetical protein
VGDLVNRFNPWRSEPPHNRPLTSLVLERRACKGKPAGWTIISTGLSPYKLFSTAWVDIGVEEGWLTLTGTEILLYTYPEPLRYTILQTDVGGHYTTVLDAAIHARYAHKPST